MSIFECIFLIKHTTLLKPYTLDIANTLSMNNSILKIAASLVLFFAIIGFNNKSLATHVAGGYIQLECTGTPGVYTLRLILYRDCSGTTLPASAGVSFTNTCGGIGNQNFTVTRQSISEVSQICPAQLANSTCNGGGLPGYEEHVYEANITLADCDTWTASYSLCCRNTTQNVVGQPVFNVTSQFNTATDNCNTSPVVTAQPEPYVCINQPVTYNLGASEPNGNTITYQLVSATSNPTTNVPYSGGASGAVPIPGVSIDPNSGTISFTPTALGAYTFVIQMTETNSDGDVVSVTNYDYQTFVENCNNDPPQSPTGGITNTSGSIVQNGPNSLTLCQGFEGCFDVVFEDPDAGDVLTVTSNLSTVLPGATITQNGVNPLTVSVCWTPITTSGVVTLNFLVEDDACPIQGQNNYGATIDVVDPGVADVSTTTETCGGADEGTATITMIGGEAPFTYNIAGPVNDANGTGNFTDLPPGNYNYTVNTAGGCDVTGTFEILPGPPLPITINTTDTECFGSCDGEATVNPGGGVSPYIYQWEDNGNPIGGNTQTISNLCQGGNYEVTVTDAIGCETSETFIINEPDELQANLDITNALCNGNCDGEIEVLNPQGGTGTYSYSIDNNPPQASPVFSGLCEGSYEIDIIDDNGCELTINGTVNEPTPLALTLDNVVDATCGADNGEIVVNASGGTTPYEFNIGGANQASNTFTGLTDDTYTVTVTDDNNCSEDITVTVDRVVDPTIFIDDQTDVSCFGGNNGTITVGNTGGVAPVEYSIDGVNFQASNQFTGLSQGNYTVELLDANGCDASVAVTIDEPPVLSYTVVETDALCNGSCDGEIEVTATGGTAPYEYSSDNGLNFSTNSDLTGLCAGTIDVVVQDDNGCLSNSTENINEPAPLSATFNNTDPICNGSCDGEIEVIMSGGTTPYEYSVDGSPFQSSNNLENLCSGNSDIEVLDANNCPLSATETLVDPPLFDIDLVDTTSSNCGANNGSLEVEATGPNTPFQYSLNGGANQPSGLFTNLVGDAYQVDVTNALGCEQTEFFAVNDVEMDGEPLDSTQVSCFGGSDGSYEVINLAGAAPITYELDNSGVTQASGLFNGLQAGGHIITIYDAGSCVYNIPFVITEPDEIAFDTDVDSVACNGGTSGSIEFTNVTGGTGDYQYSIDGGTVYQNDPLFENLSAGTYNLSIIDDNSCEVNGTVVVEESSLITFTNNVFDLNCFEDNTGVIQFTANGGTPGYEYSIDNGVTYQAGNTFTGLSSATYDLVVRDDEGCEIFGSEFVDQPVALTATYDIDDALCNGSCDGEIEITANGGTTPYTYSIDGGVSFLSSNTFTGLCEGTIQVNVVDDNDCSVDEMQTINEPTPVTFTSSETPSTCSDPNGEIEIVANGGTPGYTFSIDNGATFQAANNFTGLLAGNFDLVVEDANNCPATGTQTVTDEASPAITNLNGTDPLCNGDANGEIEVTISGGTGTITYAINGGAPQASNTFTGLASGNYTIEIFDDNNCTDTDDITLNDPTVLTYNATATDLTCFENSTGSINIVPNGGTPSYQYSFDNGVTFGTSPNSNFIAAGNYDLVVEDANGCQVDGNITVNEPPVLEFDAINIIDATCNSLCDGEISLNVIGGTAPYDYSWGQGIAGNVNTANDVCAGNYAITVTDDNGCIINDDAIVDEPDSVEIDNIITTDVVCHGDCDGTIEIQAPTGDQYSIDGGVTFQANPTFTDLCDDDYDIVVQDATGCIVESEANIWQPDPLDASLTEDTTVCYGYEYQLVAIGSGGIQPYDYSWNPGTSTTDTLDVIGENSETYTLDITDANGCTIPTLSMDLTVLPQVDVNAFNDTTICLGEETSIFATGFDGLPGYTYEWDNGQTGDQIEVSPSTETTYTVTVTDECEQSATDEVTVSIYDLPLVEMEGENRFGCIPLTPTFTNTTDSSMVGGNCVWTINGETFNSCNSVSYTFENPNCYDVTLEVTSPEGCVNDTTYIDFACADDYPLAEFTWNPNKPTVIENTVDFQNLSFDAETYNWTFGGFGFSDERNPRFSFNDISEESEVEVCLNVETTYGCPDDTCVTITIYDDFLIHVPNTFTPDGDTYNPIFMPVMPETVDIHNYHLLVFNRWGEVMFESFNPAVGWDGTYGGQIVKDGTYIWKIELEEGPDFIDREFNGHVNILR